MTKIKKRTKYQLHRLQHQYFAHQPKRNKGKKTTREIRLQKENTCLKLEDRELASKKKPTTEMFIIISRMGT